MFLNLETCLKYDSEIEKYAILYIQGTTAQSQPMKIKENTDICNKILYIQQVYAKSGVATSDYVKN